MAFVNYSNFSLVIEKNGVEIERGDYRGFALTASNVTSINNTLSNSGNTISSFLAYQNGGAGDKAWGFYQSALADTSDMLRTLGISAALTTAGDILTYYNKNVGKRYALHIRFDYISSGIKTVTLGQTFAGVTTWLSQVALDGTDSFGRMRSIAIGTLRQEYGLFPFYMVTTDRDSPENRRSDCYIWQTQGVPIFLSTNQYNYFFVFSDEWQPPAPPSPDEPYGDDTYTTSEGGEGNHDDTSDIISQDAIPIAAATRTGMCTAYVPNWGEIRDVASALLDPNWAQLLMSNIVKFSDVIIGLSVFPCAVPASYTGVVKGNVVGIEIGTGVVSHIADDQYVEINCGDLTVEEYWGNCLDYNPYTKISIFLPFCGTYELDADEVMGHTLNVSYRIDIMSGACLATIKIDGSVFYQYSGQCSAQVPLSSVSFDQFLGSMINLGVATATGVGAIGAAGAGVKEAETAFAATSGSASGGSALMEAREHLSSVKTQSANSIADATVGAVMGSKGFYTHAGAMSGSPGFLGVRTPYLTIKRPEQLIPGMYGKFHGFPCNTTAVLGDLVGYTEIGDIRLNIPDATVEEILECEQLLKGGVVI